MDFIAYFWSLRSRHAKIKMNDMELPSAIADLTTGPVAVFGFGISGRAVSNLLSSLGITWVCYDESEKSDMCRKFTTSEANEHRLVVYSPGFSLDHPWLEMARDSGCLCLNELDFASMLWSGSIIAITGTNGKTTLTEFIAGAYKKIGVEAVAAGNNKFALSSFVQAFGRSATLAVCEVSSFQAEGMRYFESNALIWTNFSEDHLDRHITMEKYFAAKWNLVHRLRRPFLLVVGQTVAQAAVEFGLHLPDFASIVDETETTPWEMPESSAFAFYPQKHNLKIAREFWRRNDLPENVIKRAARGFTPRPHRFVKVTEIDRVSYWNNSKSTDFASALAVSDSLRGPILWIGGGKSKGGDVESFARKMAAKIKGAFLIGETAPLLVRIIELHGKPARVCSDLAEAVNAAHGAAKPGDKVVLCPGFASFDMFGNYEERGDCFVNAVLSLKKLLIRC